MSSSRRSTRRPASAVALVALVLLAAGCGNKKPPEPPIRLVPERATDLEVAPRGLELQFDFAYPAGTTAGQPLTDLQAVELWRLVHKHFPRYLRSAPVKEAVGGFLKSILSPADQEKEGVVLSIKSLDEEKVDERTFTDGEVTIGSRLPWRLRMMPALRRMAR